MVVVVERFLSQEDTPQLLGGLAGELLGARTVMLAGGVGSLLMAAYWLAIPSLRRFEPPKAVTPNEFALSTVE